MYTGKAFRNIDGSYTCICNSTCTHGVFCELICSDKGVCMNDTICSCINNNSTGYYGNKCERKGCPGENNKECATHGMALMYIK